jgi:hypothetical protein
MPEGVDGVHLGGHDGGVEAEADADHAGDDEGADDGPGGDLGGVGGLGGPLDERGEGLGEAAPGGDADQAAGQGDDGRVTGASAGPRAWTFSA